MLSLAIPALLFTLLAWYDHGQVKDEARRDALTTVRALAEHAEKILESNRLVLSLMTDRVKGMSWTEIQSSREVHDYLHQFTLQLPQLESAFFVSPEGKTVSSSRGFPMFPYDVTDREYFRTAQAGNADLFISAPFRGQMARTIAFTVTRPRDPSDPTGGLVGVTLSPNYFERFYQAVTDAPTEASAALIRRDGVLLVRYPDGAALPASVSPTGIVAKITADPPFEGVLEGVCARDSRARIIAFHRVDDAPLIAVYALTLDGVLAPWYRHVAVVAALCLILASVLAYSTRSAIARTRQERRSLRLLIAETTRREQAEEALRQLQKIEALGRLTGGVAHDFNNLLTAVMGSLELALKRATEPRLVRLLKGAMEAAMRGARLTQHMLAFSRQQKLRMLPVSVNEVLRSMEDMLGRTLGPDIRLEYMLAPDLWHAVADPTQIEVAVLNLVINARDAMPLGGILRIETANVSAEAPRPPNARAGEMVHISVADTGAGMSEEVRRRAVEPFFTTKEIGRGTGLGLSMAHGFVRQAGGEIAIESEPGRGTCVSLFLPRAEPQQAPPAAILPAPAAQPPLAVLVVDDDLGVRTLTAEMLRELNHDVMEAADGQSAIACVASEPGLDIMIADFAMPHMNGGELARRVTQIRPDLPIVFVTGYAERSALEEWEARGFPVVGKPFTQQQLTAAIAESRARVEARLPDRQLRKPD